MTQAGTTNEKVEILRSVGQSECAFCLVKVPEGEGIMLNTCLHVFCRPCIITAIEESETAQIQCPVHDETHCNGLILDPEIKSLLTPASYDKYLNRSLILAARNEKDFYKCQSPNCSGIAYLEDGQHNFQCAVCSQFNCTLCKGLHSDNHDCLHGTKRGIGPSGDNTTVKRTKKEIEAEARRDAEMKRKFEAEEERKKLDAEQSADWNNRWEHMQTIIEGVGAEEDKDNLLATLLESNIILSTQPFECSICLADVSPGNGVILQDCFHTFCRDCLKSTIEHCEEPEVKCPFQGTHMSCHSVIQPREIKALVSIETYEKYLARSIAKAELSTSNSFHCKFVDCPGWCEADEEVDTFECPLCKSVNCIKCQTIHKKGETCQQYMYNLLHGANDEASTKSINALISSGKAMRCSNCKAVIVKNGGCDGIQCRICKTMLCWATKGPRWGSKGPGDTSGGCRCLLNGKMCHPKCGGCH